ncbi:hypothetical protein JXC34_03050, partial [Candidatus Woesearchaeota archaeon]|nr:hypothetical protein [Candidatus Woesearchaeota archaeon]
MIEMKPKNTLSTLPYGNWHDGPIAFRIFPTLKYNQNCIMCGCREQEEKDIDQKIWLTLMKDLAELKKITGRKLIVEISGGEPLL